MTLIQPRQAQRLQLERLLRQRILAGVYPSGSYLPSQQALSDEFGVHAGAVRDALNALIREHTCVRLKGKGVMVRQIKHLRHFFRSLTPIEDEQRDSGKTVTTRILKSEVIEATPQQIRTYTLTQRARLFHQRRLLAVNGVDYQVVDSYYPLDRYPDIEQVLTSDIPAYQHLKANYGLQPASTHKTLNAAVLDQDVCTLLGIKRRSVGSKVNGHVTDEAQQLIMFWESQIPGESLVLHNSIRL